MMRQIRLCGFPLPHTECHFALPERKWRWDLCYHEAKVALEIQGAVWRGGRHTRGAGYINDCEKMIEGQLRGWLVLWVPGDWIKSGKALRLLEKALKLRGYL